MREEVVIRQRVEEFEVIIKEAKYATSRHRFATPQYGLAVGPIDLSRCGLLVNQRPTRPVRAQCEHGPRTLRRRD